MNWWKKSLKTPKLLKCKFRGWCNFPGQQSPLTAMANRMEFSTFGLSKAEMDFNSRVAGVLQQHHPTSAAASQHQPHSTVGSPSERTCQLLRLFYPSFFDWQSN